VRCPAFRLAQKCGCLLCVRRSEEKLVADLTNALVLEDPEGTGAAMLCGTNLSVAHELVCWLCSVPRGV
jgi:hypothetical protein